MPEEKDTPQSNGDGGNDNGQEKPAAAPGSDAKEKEQKAAAALSGAVNGTGTPVSVTINNPPPEKKEEKRQDPGATAAQNKATGEFVWNLIKVVVGTAAALSGAIGLLK